MPISVISSHSPFIVSDTKQENVLIFKKDANNLVTCKRPDFNTFGASINKITMNLFERRETIGNVVNKKFENYESRLTSGESLHKLIHEINYTFGESIEKTLLINYLYSKKPSTLNFFKKYIPFRREK